MLETKMHCLYVSIGSVPISEMTPFDRTAHFARFYLRFNWIDFGRFLFFSSFPIPFRNWGSVEEGNRLCVRSLVRVLIVTLSYGARNVLSFTRSKMTNFLAFRDSPIIPLRRSPSYWCWYTRLRRPHPRPRPKSELRRRTRFCSWRRWYHLKLRRWLSEWGKPVDGRK